MKTPEPYKIREWTDWCNGPIMTQAARGYPLSDPTDDVEEVRKWINALSKDDREEPTDA